MTDKADAPVDNERTSATGAESGSTEQPSSSAPAYEAQIRALNETVETLKKGFDHQRALHDRQMQTMRQQVDMVNKAPAQPQYVAPEQQFAHQVNQEFQARDARANDMEYRLAINSFKADNPDWNDDWDDMQRILNDDIEVQRVAVYKPDGQVDYGKTLTFARQTVQNSKYAKARAAAREEKARFEQERASQQEKAVISGSSAHSLPEGITQQDIGRMSPKEMIEKGVYPIDPNDPPSFDD